MDTELTIIHAAREDEGVYSCLARNSLGAETAEATLKIYIPDRQAFDDSFNDEALRRIVNQARESVDR